MNCSGTTHSFAARPEVDLVSGSRCWCPKYWWCPKYRSCCLSWTSCLNQMRNRCGDDGDALHRRQSLEPDPGYSGAGRWSRRSQSLSKAPSAGSLRSIAFGSGGLGCLLEISGNLRRHRRVFGRVRLLEFLKRTQHLSQRR